MLIRIIIISTFIVLLLFPSALDAGLRRRPESKRPLKRGPPRAERCLQQARSKPRLQG